MLAVIIDTFGYKLMYLLHILAVIVAFAPAFVWPVVSGQLKKQGKPVGPAIGALAAGNTTKIHGPALILVGVFGMGLVGMSEKTWEFSQTWVSLALLIWFVMNGVLWGLMLPAEKQAAAGDEAADKKVAMFGGILHLLLLLMLVDMIWKPGL
ncbi:MAG: hypothetical protein JWM05_1720 [Acidimicrobiales bacterium]|nr:hypothetical protein [Acidimicrobiales bacterium]